MEMKEQYKSKRNIRQNNVSFNECYTPKYALSPLIKYINKESKIWDCAFGSGVMSDNLKEFGFNVIGNKDLNFLTSSLDCDIIITNPPYSLKDKFLSHAFFIGKPFAFLLPLTALEGIKRSLLFRNHKIQLIIPNKRIDFDIKSGKKSCWFATAWFCYGLNLPNDLNFVDINKNE